MEEIICEAEIERQRKVKFDKNYCCPAGWKMSGNTWNLGYKIYKTKITKGLLFNKKETIYGCEICFHNIFGREGFVKVYDKTLMDFVRLFCRELNMDIIKCWKDAK